MLCNSNCVTPIPAYPNGGCEVVTRKGGVARVVFKQCDYEFADILDLGEWTTAITAQSVAASGKIVGNKPKGTSTSLRVDSCSPEQKVQGTKTLQIFDYNSDNTNFAEYDFWNYIQANRSSLSVGYIDCDENFYGWIENFSVDLDDVREDSVDGRTFFDILLTWNGLLMEKPTNIPGILSTL